MCPALPLQQMNLLGVAGYLCAMRSNFVRQAGQLIEVIALQIIEERHFLVLLALLACDCFFQRADSAGVARRTIYRLQRKRYTRRPGFFVPHGVGFAVQARARWVVLYSKHGWPSLLVRWPRPLAKGRATRYDSRHHRGFQLREIRPLRAATRSGQLFS